MIPLTKENIRVGLRIHRNGTPPTKMAIIIEIFRSQNLQGKDISTFHVKWNYGVGSIRWDMNRSSDMSWEIVDDSGGSLPLKTEKPCQICTKMNDNHVTICWNCGNQP